MAPPLLTTKFYPPPPRVQLVLRARLVERLRTGLLRGCKLALISAPAGFGKTTLVVDACHNLADYAMAWLSLDAVDSEPLRFWQYFIAALQRARPEIGDLALQMLEASQPPPLETVLTRLLNDLASLQGRILLVLDDYHAIHSQAIHDGLNFLLDYLPPSLSLILTTRADPPLALARRRGRMEVVEIRAADLRFTREEGMEFLITGMALDISPADGEILLRRTEGWVAGLQMAALAVRGRAHLGDLSAEDIHRFVVSFAGDDQYIGDYLVEEVLDRQPAAVQQFLLHTSVLERFNAELCAAVLCGTQADGCPGEAQLSTLTPQTCRDLLEQLERSNLFLVPLDNRQEWYRYHRLFADLLQRRLRQTQGDDTEMALHARASRWFAANHLWMEAFEHALLARDPQAAAQILEASANDLFINSMMNTLLEWVHRLPAELVYTMPTLCMHWSWAALSTGHVEEAVSVLDEIEKRMEIDVQLLAADRETLLLLPPGLVLLLISIAAQRSSIAVGGNDIAYGMKVAEDILHCLGLFEGQEQHAVADAFGTVAQFNLGLGYEALGDVESAGRAFMAAVAGARKYQNLHILTLATSHLALLRSAGGRLSETEAVYQEALRVVSDVTGRPSPFISMAHAGLAQLYYEWNRLDAARQEYEQSLALGIPWTHWESLVPAAVGLARTRLALGDRQGALVVLEDTDALWQRMYRAGPLPIFQGWRAVISGAMDPVAEALFSLDEHSEWMSKASLFYSHDLQALLLIRLLMLQGALDRALARVEVALADAARGKRLGSQVYGLALKVAALQQANRLAEALSVLEQALELAQPGGYVRAFVDEGLPMAVALSHLARSAERPALARYARQLLAAFPAHLLDEGTAGAKAVLPAHAAPAVDEPPLPAGLAYEPLSDREVEVLGLLSEGLSNSQIAARLVITPGTVKVHTSNIYAKLGVNSRSAAVARAGLLGILRR